MYLFGHASVTMASASDPDESLKCPICVENYKEPRKLPGCSHSFCENCILTYVLKLKQEDTLGLEFQCPVCRLPTNVPDNTDITIEWIQTMDKDAKLESTLNKQETKIDDGSCCRCKYLSKNNKAKHYCLNCQEYLCVACTEILHASKLGRTHTLINAESTDKSDKLQSPALKLMSELLTCKVHADSKIEMYCELHDDLICSTCAIVKHRNCKTIKEIKDITKTSLQSEASTLINTSEKLVKHMNNIIDVYKENEVETKQDITKIRTGLQEMKQDIIRIFDTMEESLNQEAGAITKNWTIKCLDEIEFYRGMIHELNCLTYLIQKILTNAPETHVFVCIKKIKPMCQDIEKKLVHRENPFIKKRVELKSGELSDRILRSGADRFVHLASIKEKKTPVKLQNNQDIAFQRNFGIKTIGSKRIRPTDSECGPTYNSILFLPNETLLLVDSFTEYCCLVNEQYKEIASGRFESNIDSNKGRFKVLKYATLMPNNLLAVSLAIDKKICFVSSDDLTVKGEVRCMHTPKAICALNSNHEIALSWEDPVAFGIIAVQGGSYSEVTYFTEDKSGRKLKSFDYMAVDKKRRHVIQSCDVNKAVYCFNLEGSPVFSYKNEGLRKPRGVAIDADGNIFVCNKGPIGSIHILSSYGMPIRIFKEQCPANPLAIGFNAKGNRFAVSMSCSSLFFLLNDNGDEINFFVIASEDK